MVGYLLVAPVWKDIETLNERGRESKQNPYEFDFENGKCPSDADAIPTPNCSLVGHLAPVRRIPTGNLMRKLGMLTQADLIPTLCTGILPP